MFDPWQEIFLSEHRRIPHTRNVVLANLTAALGWPRSLAQKPMRQGNSGP